MLVLQGSCQSESKFVFRSFSLISARTFRRARTFALVLRRLPAEECGKGRSAVHSMPPPQQQ